VSEGPPTSAPEQPPAVAAAAGPAPGAPAADTGLPIEEISTPKRAWRLVLFPPGLRLDPVSLEPPLHVARERFASAASIDERRKRLTVKQPRRRTFQLDETSFKALQEWLGPAILLKLALRARLMAAIPVGAFWMVTSVPLGCEKALGVETPTPVDPFGLVMGVVLFVMGFVAQTRPHRVFFLLDSVWFMALSAWILVRIAVGTDGPFWLIFVAWCVMLVVAGVQSFRRFGTPGRAERP
jgi:hypothetical protein